MKFHRETVEIQKLAWPILANYALTSLFEVLDEAVVGHYSADGFALVGIGAGLIYAITGALGVLSAVFSVIAAEKIGKGDEAGLEESFSLSRKLAVFIGIGVILLANLGGKWLFATVYRIAGEQLAVLQSYFGVASVTVLQNMLFFLYSAYFRNKKDTKTGLIATGVSTGVNLLLDYALVHGRFGLPELGVTGAAWGSVLGLVCGQTVFQRAFFRCKERKKGLFTVRRSGALWRHTKALLRLYPPLLGQEFLEDTALSLVVTAAVARLGTEQMAAYKLLDVVCGIVGLPVYAYATAAQTFALQKHGAKQEGEATKYLKAGVRLGVLAVLTLGILCGIWQETVFGWVLPDAQIAALTGKFLGLALGIQVVKAPYQVYMNYLQGVGRERFVLAAAAVGTAAVCTLVPVLGSIWQLAGIYLAVLAEYAALGWVYVWKKR